MIDLLFNDPGQGKTNNDFINVVFAITDVPGPELATTLDQISPIGLADMIEIPIGNDSMVYGNLAGRFDDIRSGVDEYSAGVSKVPLSTKDDDKKQMEPPVQEGETPNHWSLWSSGIGGFATASTTFDQPGYSFTTSGVMIGADYRARRNLVFGVVGTYLDANSSSADSARVELNTGKLGGYGTWWDDSGNYVQGYAGGGFDNYITERAISLPGFMAGTIPGTTGSAGGPYRVARGDTNGAEANISLGTGHDWKMGNFLAGPTLGLQYDYVDIDGFGETGANSLDLNVQKQAASSLQSLLGMRASYVWRINPEQSIVPYVSAQWEHEYLDGSHTIGASMLGQSFSVESSAFGRDGILIDAGVTINWSKRVSTFLGYQGELGRTGYTDNSVFGGFCLKF
jgi:outer membrane lipase/esterase